MPKPTKVITVSGVVGAGKSTFIKSIAGGLSIPAFYENVDGNPLLEAMYSDSKRWAMTLQINFLREKYAQMVEASKIGKCLVERTIFEDILFTKTHLNTGNISNMEWDVYHAMYEHFTNAAPNPDLVVFLDVSDELALQRIEERGRPFEQGLVQRDLFRLQNQLYREWIDTYEGPKLIVDNNKFDYLNNNAHRQQMIDYIRLFLKEGTY